LHVCRLLAFSTVTEVVVEPSTDTASVMSQLNEPADEVHSPIIWFNACICCKHLFGNGWLVSITSNCVWLSVWHLNAASTTVLVAVLDTVPDTVDEPVLDTVLPTVPLTDEVAVLLPVLVADCDTVDEAELDTVSLAVELALLLAELDTVLVTLPDCVVLALVLAVIDTLELAVDDAEELALLLTVLVCVVLGVLSLHSPSTLSRCCSMPIFIRSTVAAQAFTFMTSIPPASHAAVPAVNRFGNSIRSTKVLSATVTASQSCP
jgi:hypothetical protein